MNLLAHKNWREKSRKEQLTESIEHEKRQVEQLKNSSWMGDPPWLYRESVLQSLEHELFTLEQKDLEK